MKRGGDALRASMMKRCRDRIEAVQQDASQPEAPGFCQNAGFFRLVK
jgi:hypothetical protein